MDRYTIVFDLDGTLVETAPDLVRATNHVLALKGLPPVPHDAIRPHISFGARAMITEGLRLHGAALDSAETDDLHARFLAFYGENIAVGSHVFPGLETALDALAAAGARLAVCTNKQERPSRQLLDALGLTRRFQAIAGRDTFAVFKPHPGHLTGAIERAGGTPGRAIMVGDSDTDVQTARAAGIPVIGVPFGYTDVPMADLAPDALVSHYDELVETVKRLVHSD
ncbi:MAG: phosphoglycolate phosphatase [Hyphomicrobiaceae bacterium]